MIARLLLALVALFAFERAADACCLGCPCTKYQPQTVTMQQPVYGYTRSVRGGLPKWSVERIATFLTAGTWTPTTKPPPSTRAPAPRLDPGKREGGQIEYHVIPARPLRFVTADQAANVKAGKDRLVLIRRIEKQGSAILVEVDSEVWKLAACPRKAGFACLVSRGALELAPIAPPGDGFAKPPEATR